MVNALALVGLIVMSAYALDAPGMSMLVYPTTPSEFPFVTFDGDQCLEFGYLF